MDGRLIILFGQWNKMGLEPSFSLVTVRNRLAEVFGHRVIALHHDVEWPPRSPDLTCDFFLWGYLKSKVFATPPHWHCNSTTKNHRWVWCSTTPGPNDSQGCVWDGETSWSVCGKEWGPCWGARDVGLMFTERYPDEGNVKFWLFISLFLVVKLIFNKMP